MNRTAVALILSASAMLPLFSAQAAVTIYTATLSSAQEVPPNASPGTGFAVVTIDDVLNTMRVEANFSGLIGNTSASHIHCCAPPGVNAPVATQTPSFIGFPLGVQSGTFDSTFDMTLASSYRAGFITANGGTPASAFAVLFSGMNAGNAYFNIHTDAFPGGEIRGQLAAIPEPSTWAMLLIGFAGAGWSIRRKSSTAVATG